jgi:hypothetical protein
MHTIEGALDCRALLRLQLIQPVHRRSTARRGSRAI